MRLEPIDPKHSLSLRDRDARPPKDAPSGDQLAGLIEAETERIGHLQKVFYAAGTKSLLVILQGRDAAGKDGTIRHVFRAVNPQGCQVTSFGRRPIWSGSTIFCGASTTVCRRMA